MNKTLSLILYLLKCLAIIIAAVIAMFILAFIPPFFFLYDWLCEAGLDYIWTGLSGAVAAFCAIIYTRRLKKKQRTEDENGDAGE